MLIDPTQGYLKRQVTLKQQFTIEKGYYEITMIQFTMRHILSLTG
jgi:hypothetical protein